MFKRTLMSVSVLSVLFSASAFAISSTEVTVPAESGYASQEEYNSHIQRQANGNTNWNGRQQEEIDENTAWNDRQEGVIRQNRGRIDDLYGTVETNDETSRDRDQKLEKGVNKNAQAIATGQERTEEVDTQSRERDARLARQAQANMDWSIEQFNQQGQQLSSVQKGVESNRQAIDEERQARKEMGKDHDAGIAMAVAAGSHQFDTSYQGAQLSLSGGFYRGASAQSLAVGGAFTDSVFGHVNVSNDSRGHQAVGVNTTWKF